MADYAEETDLPDHKLGDSWVGITTIGPVVVSGIGQGTLSRIVMVFVREDSSTTYTLDSERSQITIDDDATWEAHIDPVPDFLRRAGDWEWAMQFTHDGGVSPVTLYKGTLTVLPNLFS